MDRSQYLALLEAEKKILKKIHDEGKVDRNGIRWTGPVTSGDYAAVQNLLKLDYY